MVPWLLKDLSHLYFNEASPNAPGIATAGGSYLLERYRIAPNVMPLPQ